MISNNEEAESAVQSAKSQATPELNAARHAFDPIGNGVDECECGQVRLALIHLSDDVVGDRYVPIEPEPSTATLALNEAHKRLDEAGIPPAQYTVCDDPTCQSLVGHRIQALVAQRDALAEALKSILNTGRVEMLALKDETPTFTRWAVSTSDAALSLVKGQGK